MSRADNEAVIRRYIDAWQRGDGVAAMVLWADDVAHHVPGRHRLAGDFAGKQAFLDAYGARFAELNGTIEVVAIRDVLVSDAHAVLLVTERAIRGARTLDWDRIVVYRFAEGRIAETWSYDGNPYALDEFWA